MVSQKQQVFRDMILGILLYSVVLGFFNDYTKILSTSSYSMTFSVAIVMQLLTYATFKFKDLVVDRFKQVDARKFWLIFSIWLIMFVSKFVFLAVISVVFRQEVEISGFVGLLLIIICLTLVQNIVVYIDNKLAE